MGRVMILSNMPWKIYFFAFCFLCFHYDVAATIFCLYVLPPVVSARWMGASFPSNSLSCRSYFLACRQLFSVVTVCLALSLYVSHVLPITMVIIPIIIVVGWGLMLMVGVDLKV